MLRRRRSAPTRRAARRAARRPCSIISGSRVDARLDQVAAAEDVDALEPAGDDAALLEVERGEQLVDDRVGAPQARVGLARVDLAHRVRSLVQEAQAAVVQHHDELAGGGGEDALLPVGGALGRGVGRQRLTSGRRGRKLCSPVVGAAGAALEAVLRCWLSASELAGEPGLLCLRVLQRRAPWPRTAPSGASPSCPGARSAASICFWMRATVRSEPLSRSSMTPWRRRSASSRTPRPGRRSPRRSLARGPVGLERSGELGVVDARGGRPWRRPWTAPPVASGTVMPMSREVVEPGARDARGHLARRPREHAVRPASP